MTYFVSAAASLVAASFIIWMGYNETPISDNVSEVVDKINYPTLILGSGEKIKLSDSYSKLITIEHTIKKSGSSNIVKDTAKELYNTVIIPNQYTHTIILEDGTEVFLNAGSELKYPTTFNLSAREVFLRGEAYFKVTKSERQFIVHTSDMDIKVYGTEFNINTNRRNSVETILVKGSIGACFGKNELKMHPNELLIFNLTNGDKIVHNVTTNDYLGWMSGDFLCNAQPLSKLLDDVSAWFGVIFNENSQLNNCIVNVNISRDIELEKLLEIIQEMLGVTFIKEGRNIYSIK